MRYLITQARPTFTPPRHVSAHTRHNAHKEITVPSTCVKSSLRIVAITLLLPSVVLDAQQAQGPLASITEAELRDHIFFLASDFLEGRDAHEMGYMLAAEYGAIHFAAAGLQRRVARRDGRQ